ncbi:MAG: NPCBM/NEW2 domain-containing protein [Candidatus Xenobia bacterium]
MTRKLAALLLIVLITQIGAWANPYDPLESDPVGGKGKGVNKPPPAPKPFMDKDGLRYYALDDFVRDECNVNKKLVLHNVGPYNKPLAIGDQTFKHGLCYPQKAEIETFVQWHLDGKYANLECTVGTPDDFKGNITVYVYGDDRRLYRSDELTADKRYDKIQVPVDGVELLSIRTHATKEVGPVHIVVGDPTLTREPGI